MGSLAFVLLVLCISICSGTAIPGDQDQDTILIKASMLQKVENVSSQLQEHDRNMQDLIEAMNDRLTQLEIGLDSTREMLPSETIQDMIDSALMNGLRNISQDEGSRFFAAPPTTTTATPITRSPHAMYGKEIPSDAGKFYCDLDTDGELAKGSCYFFSSDRKTWSSARDKCIEMGYDLVKIDNTEEYTFIQKQIVDDAWIGLTDKEIEGEFRWVIDGSLHDLRNLQDWWGEGEPNSAGSEDCVHIRQGSVGLNDKSCSHEGRYICEMQYKDILL